MTKGAVMITKGAVTLTLEQFAFLTSLEKTFVAFIIDKLKLKLKKDDLGLKQADLGSNHL